VSNPAANAADVVVFTLANGDELLIPASAPREVVGGIFAEGEYLANRAARHRDRTHRLEDAAVRVSEAWANQRWQR
jgi:hypothetical protein